MVFDTDKAANVTNVISISSDKTDIKKAENTTEVINKEDPGNKTSESDLDIVKVVYSVDGDRIVWAISVINNGPDKASNVRVYDVLPETLKFVSSAVSALCLPQPAAGACLSGQRRRRLRRIQAFARLTTKPPPMWGFGVIISLQRHAGSA